jgi:ERCC4-related helicase
VQNPAILGGENVSCLTDAAIEILNDKEEKFIIGCVYIGMSELAYKAIESKFSTRDVFLVNGTIKNKDRYDIIEEWKKSRNSIIVTTIKAMSEGLNLDICDNMMYLDYDWSNSANSQFSNRIHRMTSTDIKFYYHLIVRNTCHEYKYYKLMNEDKRMSQAINDTPSNIKYLAEQYINYIKEGEK